MKERIQSGLQFFCTNKDNKSVSQILDQYKIKDQMDVLYDNGAYFHTAISHDNPSLVSILLNYMYDTKQINTDPKDNNTNQSIRYNDLQNILRECKKEYKISSEIESIIENICYDHTDDEEDSMDFVDYKEDLKEENISYIFEDNSTRESPDRELVGKEEFTNLEDVY